jgi:hypothetical protein
VSFFVLKVWLLWEILKNLYFSHFIETKIFFVFIKCRCCRKLLKIFISVIIANLNLTMCACIKICASARKSILHNSIPIVYSIVLAKKWAGPGRAFGPSRRGYSFTTKVCVKEGFLIVLALGQTRSDLFGL